MHGHQQLRGGPALPGLHAQGAGNREAHAIGVADVEAQARAFHGRALDIQGEQRSRQVDALFIDLGQHAAVDALAAHHAVHIGNQQVHELDLGVFRKELVRLVEQNGTRRGQHDGTPFLLKISIT
ncbi:hypothetical protein D3C78_1295770 [compost metagenome]